MLWPLVKTCKNIESKIKASIYGAIEVKSTHAFFSKLKSNCSNYSPIIFIGNDCQKVPVSQDNFYFTQQETSPETIKQLALKLEDDRENELLQFWTTNKDWSSFEKYNESQKEEYVLSWKFNYDCNLDTLIQESLNLNLLHRKDKQRKRVIFKL